MDKKEIVREGYNKAAETLEKDFGIEREEEEEEVKALLIFHLEFP